MKHLRKALPLMILLTVLALLLYVGMEIEGERVLPWGMQL